MESTFFHEVGHGVEGMVFYALEVLVYQNKGDTLLQL